MATPITPLTIATPLSLSALGLGDPDYFGDSRDDSADLSYESINPIFMSPALSLDEHTSVVTRLRVPRRTNLLLSSSLDGTVRIWAPSHGEVDSRAVLDAASFNLSSSSSDTGGGRGGGLSYSGDDGSSVDGVAPPRVKLMSMWAQEGCESVWAAGSDCALRVWSGQEGRPSRFLRGHEDTVTILEGMSGIGGLQTSCLVGSGSADKTVRIWDARAKRAQVFVFKGHSDAITALRWGEGGRSVFSAAKDKTIRIWDTRAGRQRVALEKHFGAVTALRAIPEALQCNAIKSGVGAAFMSGGRDAMVNLWTSTGDCVGTQAAHRGQVVSLSDINCGLNYRGLSGQPLLFSLGADSMLKLWELRRFRAVAEIPLGQQCTKGVWAGQSIVTSGPTGTVTCWNYSGAASASASASAAAAAASMGASSDESSSSSSGWKGRDLSCHSAACTDLISTESVVASAAKNGQVLVWGGAGV